MVGFSKKLKLTTNRLDNKIIVTTEEYTGKTCRQAICSITFQQNIETKNKIWEVIKYVTVTFVNLK